MIILLNKLKGYFSSKIIPFTEHNAAADEDAAQETVVKTKQMAISTSIIDDKAFATASNVITRKNW